MKLKEFFQNIKRNGRNVLTLEESAKVLEYYGIPFVKSEIIKSIEEAVAVANRIGYPVVLKIISSEITHKTDVGGLVVNIRNDSELQNAYRQIISNVKKKVPNAKIDGVFVQPMIEDGIEVIVGGKKDQQFGQVLMFGLGGIFVEVFEDVSFRVVPINRKDAEEMVKEIKGFKILKDYRGKSYDVEAIVDTLIKTSKLLEENCEIEEIDINPVIVLKKGVVAVDARIRLNNIFSSTKLNYG
jgi:acetyl-CoA synthetase (ADP-forming)